MEGFRRNPLLEVKPDDVKKIRLFLQIDLMKLEENLDTIEEWCKKQDHLTEVHRYMKRSFIEHLYILSKGYTELTKTKIDKLLTTRRMLADLTLNKSCEEFEKYWDKMYFVPLQILNPSNQTRCVFVKPKCEITDADTLLALVRYCATVTEFRLFNDYTLGDTFIWDLSNASMHFLSNPILINKTAILYSDAYNIRVKAVYLINTPPYIDKIFSVIKPFLKPKLVSRFHIISSYKDLRKEIPKEILPVDYGGESASLSELSVQWKDFLKSDESIKLINDLNKMISDESKRSCIQFNEEYLGMPGSFRQLTVD